MFKFEIQKKSKKTEEGRELFNRNAGFAELD